MADTEVRTSPSTIAVTIEDGILRLTLPKLDVWAELTRDQALQLAEVLHYFSRTGRLRDG